MLAVDFRRRANPQDLVELMDQPCSYAELQGCLRDIEFINRLTFAYRPTLKWLKAIVERQGKNRPLHIVDVGCGHGDMLRAVHRWGKRKGVPVVLVGIDLNADAIRAAKEATKSQEAIQWICGDAYSYGPGEGIDVVLSSLLTHHLEAPEIVRFLRWMETTTRLGWFINDLHRKPLPYKLFGLLTKILPLHPFVQNDGLVSIRRSFLASDWRELCRQAGLSLEAVTINGYRPARLCVERTKI